MFSCKPVEVDYEGIRVYEANKKFTRQFLLTVLDNNTLFKFTTPLSIVSKLNGLLSSFFEDKIIEHKDVYISMLRCRLPNFFVAARLRGKRELLDSWFPEEVLVEEKPIVIEVPLPALNIQIAEKKIVLVKNNEKQESVLIENKSNLEIVDVVSESVKSFNSEIHPFPIVGGLLGGSSKRYQKKKKIIVNDSFKILKMEKIINQKGGTNVEINVTQENGYTCYVCFDYLGEHVEIESTGTPKKQVQAEESCFKQLNTFFRDYKTKVLEDSIDYGSDQERQVEVESEPDEKSIFKTTVESQEKRIRSIEGFSSLGRSFFSYEELGDPVLIKIKLTTDSNVFDVESDSYLDAFDILFLNVMDFIRNSANYGLVLSSYCSTKNYPPPFVKFFEVKGVYPPLVGQLDIGNFSVVSKKNGTRDDILKELVDRSIDYLDNNDITPNFLNDPGGMEFTDDAFDDYTLDDSSGD